MMIGEGDDKRRHCDDYIDDPLVPKCLRFYVFYNRLPAVTKDLCREAGVIEPKLFATYEGVRVRVVMASRFGDVGISKDLKSETGYYARVAVQDLDQFSDVS